jgi:antitoxin CptB
LIHSALAAFFTTRYSTIMTIQSQIKIRRRKLLFRARRRGFREVDAIFSAFADAHLACLDEGQLDRFEALLAVPDWRIYGWLTGEEAVPREYDNDVFALLRSSRSHAGP